MTLFGSARGSAFGTASSAAEKKDPIEVRRERVTHKARAQIGGAPDDTVQVLRFNPQPTANLLASGSWDNLLRIWEVKSDGKSAGKAEQTLPGSNH